MPFCPSCKGENGRLIIRSVLTDAEIVPDGAECIGDIEWGDDNSADCSCGWEGTVADLLDELPEPGDDVCDLCMTSKVNAERTTYCGKTIGVECGCDAEHEDGTCDDPDCEDCKKGLKENDDVVS